MKGTFVTLCALAVLAFAGSFFEMWRLPYQTGDPFTYRDVYRKMKKATSYDEDMLKDSRNKARADQERIFKKDL